MAEASGMESTTWHYPPDFLSRMIDTIPLLVKSKVELLGFFKGAGVSEDVLGPMRTRVAQDRSSVNMYEITRHVLFAVNEITGDEGLRVRREIVKRVTQFSAFENCYPNNVLKARGGVQFLSEYVRDRNTSARLDEHHHRELAKHIADSERKRDEIVKRRQVRSEIARDLGALFSAQNASLRGKRLESVLNRLFRHDGVLVREAFVLTSPSGNGITEQIDGVIEFDGNPYLVEMKWFAEPLGVHDVSDHMTRVFSRAQSRGICIANPGYTRPAIEKVRDFLRDAPFILCDLEEVVRILDAETTVGDWLRPKIQAAIVDRNPYKRFSE